MPGKQTSIAQKIRRVIMLVSTVVLLLTATAFIIFEIVAYQRSLAEYFTSLGGVIAVNATGTLAFDDAPAATEILAALRVDRNVTQAALYDSKGKLFAHYPPDPAPPRFASPPERGGHSFSERELVVVQPVIEAGTRHGTLYLHSDLTPMFSRFRLYGWIVFLVLIGSTLVAFFLSSSVQQRVSKPILALAAAARRVSQLQDYSVRAEKSTHDEIGLLTDAFNHMLTQIHERDVALRQNEERLRLALEASRTGIWNWNITTDTWHWDEHVHALFGMDPDQPAGSFLEFIDRIHPSDRAYVSEVINRGLRDKTEFSMEYRVLWPNDEVRFLSSRGKAFHSPDGKPLRMTGVTMDITEIKKAEREIVRLNSELEERVLARTAELAATNRELEAFTYSVSHDLRAPLRHINAYAQILDEDYSTGLPGEAKKYVERIQQGTKNMGNLVDDLLNLARIGRQEINRQPIDLNELVEEVVNELKIESGDRQIEWQLGKLPVVQGDVGLLRQVFRNLIGNAFKYSRKRERAIIEVGVQTPEGRNVIFVRDNGVGFNMKYANKLFAPFQRLHRVEDFEGSGVGLAIVERIIRKHGGQIWAEAELDKGAAFYFTLEGAHPTLPAKLS